MYLPKVTIILLLSLSYEISGILNWELANCSISLSATSYCGVTSIPRHKFTGNSAGFIVFSTIYNEKYDAEGYIGYRPVDKMIYVVFRGSYSIANWIADLDYFTTPYPGCANCRVHLGFYNYEQSIIKDIIKDVISLQKKFPEYGVISTGHSLGAACASLVAADLIMAGIKTTLINFGSPRFANKELSEYLSTLIPSITRVTHHRDLVPHIPPALQGFQHISGEYYEDVDGSVRECSGYEDPTCSDQFTLSTSLYDHYFYLGVTMSCDTENNNITRKILEQLKYDAQKLSLRGVHY